MPSDFDIVYPPNERVGFDGGKNNKFDKQIIADNESPDCLNVIFNNGSVETRGGSEMLNTQSVGTFAGEGLYTRHDNTGAQSMCAFWNGSMFTWNAVSFATVPSAQSVYTAGGRVGACEYENYLFNGNGFVEPYKYNSHFTRHGIPAPTATSTVGSQAVGVLTGDFRYKVTYVNSALVEGDVSPVTATFTAAGATLRVSAIPVAPASFGVNQRRLYRTTVGGTVFKRLTTINDNTTTTYDDNTADVDLGANAPTDNGEPPKYSVCLAHQDRIWCNDPANPNFVWYSELATPYVFGSANFVRIGDNTTDIVRCLDVYDGNIVVRCDHSAYIIYLPSTDPTEWFVRKAKASYGSKSPFGAFLYNNRLMFPALQSFKMVGFAALFGDTVDADASFLTSTTAGSETKSQRIEPDIFNIQTTPIDRISAIVYQNKAYIAVSYGDQITRNNYIYIFDFSIENLAKRQEGSWVPWTGLAIEQFTVYQGLLYGQGSATNGRVFKLNTDTANDDGAAINSYFWTKEFSGKKGDENWDKDFRFANLLFKNIGDYFMDFTYRVNSDSGDGNTQQIDLDAGGSNWNTMIWGISNWGGGAVDNDQRIYLGQTRGKRIQFKFSNQNTANQKFKIIGLNFAYNKKGKR